MESVMRPNPIDVRVGGNLRSARQRQGLTLETMARLLEISAKDLIDLEEGEERLLPKCMFRAVEVLGASIAELFKGVDDLIGSGAERVPAPYSLH